MTPRRGTPPKARARVSTLRGKTDAWVAIVDDDSSVRSSLARALWLEGIRTVLFAFPDDTIVHSGHGPDTTIGAERANLDG